MFKAILLVVFLVLPGLAQADNVTRNSLYEKLGYRVNDLQQELVWLQFAVDSQLAGTNKGDICERLGAFSQEVSNLGRDLNASHKKLFGGYVNLLDQADIDQIGNLDGLLVLMPDETTFAGWGLTSFICTDPGYTVPSDHLRILKVKIKKFNDLLAKLDSKVDVVTGRKAAGEQGSAGVRAASK